MSQNTIDRRTFIRQTGAGLAALTLGVSRGLKAAPAGRPNIVLIMADDIGYECFGCYGSDLYKTPNLDQLAATGIRFDYCFAQPLCTPSRVKIMTGKSNIRNYVEFGIMDPLEKTFGHMMQQAGYKTAVAGKWQLFGSIPHPNLVGKGMHPRQAGFDEYCLWQVDDRPSRYWQPGLDKNDKKIKGGPNDYGPDMVCDFINDFIERHQDEKFFVYYPMILVHAPFETTPHSKDRDSKDRISNYRDMVAYMDFIIGRIVKKLDELNLRDNTLILFTGDNGTTSGIKSPLHGREIIGAKGKTTDAGTHVPLIANWPARIKQASTCDDLVDFSDFVPTLAELAGAEILPGPIDGVSFAPRLLGKKVTPRDCVYCYYNPRHSGFKDVVACFARDHRYKLYGDGRFYDLKQDPLEKAPLALSNLSGQAKKSHALLQQKLNQMDMPPGKIGSIQ